MMPHERLPARSFYRMVNFMGTRQIAAQQTRLNIIAAAEKLIRERGFENVGVIDITNEAGVAKGSFYTYFKKKEDVVCEVTHNDYAAFEEKSKKAGTVDRQIACFLDESMRYNVAVGLNICQQWLKNVVNPAEELGRDKLAYDRRVIQELLSSAVECGELKKGVPVERITETIVAVYYGAVAIWAITNGKTDPVSLIRSFEKDSLNVILSKYKKPTNRKRG